MGRNIQELSVGDTSVGYTLTLHPFFQYTNQFLGLGVPRLP
jgi:hypothetical protein